NVTLEVDGQTVTRYNGGYDFYLKERTQRHEALVAARRNQDRLREQTQRFIDTFRYTPTKAAQVQSRIKMLEKMEEIVVPREATTAGKIRLPEFQHSGTTALNIKDVGFSYDGSHWVFRNVSFQVGRGEQLALVGFNGMGKTTLSRLFSKVLDPTEGEIILGHKVVPGYVSQDISETIPPERSLINAVRMEDGTLTEATARNLLGSFGFSGDDAFKTAGVLSGGEKIRLAFARIYAAKANLLILDEPTTHLDINGRRALEEELVKYEGTVIIVSHDVEFVRTVAHNIIEVSNGNVRKFLGGYDDFLAFQNKRTAPDPSLQQTSSGIKTEPTDNSSKTVNDKKVLSRKEIRRQRAMEREKIKPLINSLKRRVAASEKRIIQLEEEQGQLVERLSLEGDDKPDFESINRRLSEIQKELESVNTLWEQAASELAFLEAE
ncbi:MAG: ATP-binding cassette domain-containing protein, partial [Lentisphaerae bacterium]|nr:ATP-binding cassette domain-containing protein [Lentisphaerota bacterium]